MPHYSWVSIIAPSTVYLGKHQRRFVHSEGLLINAMALDEYIRSLTLVANPSMYLVSLDLCKGFDSVTYLSILRGLRWHGANEQLMEYTIQVGGSQSGKVHIRRGVKQ